MTSDSAEKQLITEIVESFCLPERRMEAVLRYGADREREGMEKAAQTAIKFCGQVTPGWKECGGGIAAAIRDLKAEVK